MPPDRSGRRSNSFSPGWSGRPGGPPGVGVPACLRALPAETVRRGDRGVRGGGEVGDVSGGAGAARVLEGEGPHRVRREAEGGGASAGARGGSRRGPFRDVFEGAAPGGGLSEGPHPPPRGGGP